MSNKNEKALTQALYQLLRPLARLLLRRGVSYSQFAELARRAFIDVAEQDFKIEGRKQTLSRISVLTGINRKDVSKIQKQPHPLAGTPVPKLNRASRIINAWLHYPEFINSDGSPKVLPLTGTNETSFEKLVKTFGGDVPARAVLDELERLNAVSTEKDQITLLTRAYIPNQDEAQRLRIFGQACRDLLSTLDYNLADGESEQHKPILQRTVAYANIPEELLTYIRDRANSEGQEFLLQINQWLAQCDRDTNDELHGSGSTRAGIGIYYFEESKQER